jgi:hopene-associated glycosyltransferase HpnB
MISAASILLIFASISVAIWIILILFRGGFWRSDQFLSPALPLPENLPEIVAVIPARNEEMTIGRAITSLLKQKYKGKFSVIVVNDNSDDNTSSAAEVAGQGKDNLTIIDGQELPDGWTGKMWAVAQGIEFAKSNNPNAAYLLLTDADISHHSENLNELASKALNEDLALVSLMVKLRCTSAWEHLLIPAFVFFFQKLYPFQWVNDPSNDTAGAAGGCMLVNRLALEKSGGIEAIKNEIIDDCSLAKQLKKTGPIWLGLTRSTTSLRGYDDLTDVWHMVCRTAFVQLNHSALNLLGTIIGMLFIYAIPIASILIGFLSNNIELLLLGLAGWVMMAIAYTPTLRLYSRPIWEACLLPFAAMLYSAMTIDSARKYWVGNAPTWKGRKNIK